MLHLRRVSVRCVRRAVLPRLYSTPADRIFDVEDDTFEELVKESSLPVIVDLQADWCQPCRILGPKLEALVSATEGVKLARLDVDSNDRVASDLQVNAIPAVFAFYKGKVVTSFVGVRPDDQLKNFVENVAQVPTREDWIDLEDEE